MSFLVSRTRSTNYPAFTLVELLIVILVIFLLMALLIPAVYSARESSRKLYCSNNLRQIGLAINSYHDINGSFPPGRFPSFDSRYAGTNPPCTSTMIDKSLHIMILAQLEQLQLYNSINHGLSIFSYENRSSFHVVVSAFCCPSDTASGYSRDADSTYLTKIGLFKPGDHTLQMAFTSYVGSFGSLAVNATVIGKPRCFVSPHLLQQCNGVFNDITPLSLSSIIDGSSSTIIVSERSTSRLQHLDYSTPSISKKYGWYVSGNLGDSLFSTMSSPNSSHKMSPLVDVALTYSASSNHSGGVNALFADGSVRFITDSVQSWPNDPFSGEPLGSYREIDGWFSSLPSPCVWQALSTRSGSEIYSSDSY